MGCESLRFEQSIEVCLIHTVHLSNSENESGGGCKASFFFIIKAHKGCHRATCISIL